MNVSTSSNVLQLSRFDRVVLLTMVGLLGVVGLLVWRGDRVGARVETLRPNVDDTAVSTQATIRVTFSQAMVPDNEVAVQLEPPVQGTTQWEGRSLVFVPDQPLDELTAYRVTVPAGLQSRQGRLLLKPLTWQFRTGEPRIIYIGWEQDRGGNQIYVVSANGGEPTRLTHESINVLDYAVAPDGQMIAYVATRQDGGNDLWAIDSNGRSAHQLLDCEGASCSKPVWAANGRQLVYERRNFLPSDSAPGPPRLWWLDTVTGVTTAVFEDSQWLGLAARFSPDGNWLSYVSPQLQEVQAYHLSDGRSLLIPSQTGEPGHWSPDGQQLVTTQLQLQSDSFAIHIVKADVNEATVVNLSGEEAVNDGWPVWSPSGEWIAFNRKVPRTPAGKQIWMMRPDGGEATNLTNNPDIHHGPPSWSPDARSLTFQGYSLSKPDEPGIWVLNVDDPMPRKVASSGIQPSWLP